MPRGLRRDDGEEKWTWIHKPTGIQVWRDAIDLTAGEGGDVFFHYTSEVAFGNITHPSKEATEVWASLNTSGPNANAWWGPGVYTVPLAPDRWEDREELLDNNFRNMMRRDREDPQRGVEYVKEIWLEVTEAYKVLTNPKRNRRDRSNGFKQGSVYRDDERVQDDSELQKQFFEALGVMPSDQKKSLKMTLEDLKKPKLSSRSDAAEQQRRKQAAEAQNVVTQRPKVATGKSA